RRGRVRCPECTKRRDALLLHKGAWKCRQCHHLKYRSTMVDTRCRRLEKLQRLKAELELIPRTKKCRAERQTKLEAVTRLQRQVKSAPRIVASERQTFRLHSS